MHTPFSDHSAIMLNIQSVDQRQFFQKNSESMSLLLDLLEKFERCSGYKKITTRNQKKCRWENGKTENTLRSLLRNSLGIYFSNSEKVK